MLFNYENVLSYLRFEIKGAITAKLCVALKLRIVNCNVINNSTNK